MLSLFSLRFHFNLYQSMIATNAHIIYTQCSCLQLLFSFNYIIIDFRRILFVIYWPRFNEAYCLQIKWIINFKWRVFRKMNEKYELCDKQKTNLISQEHNYHHPAIHST